MRENEHHTHTSIEQFEAFLAIHLPPRQSLANCLAWILKKFHDFA